MLTAKLKFSYENRIFQMIKNIYSIAKREKSDCFGGIMKKSEQNSLKDEKK